MYNPEFTATVHAKRRGPGVSSAKAGERLWLFLSGELAEKYRAEALARGVRPNVLLGALLHVLAEGGLIDSVLDGDDPNLLAPGHAKRLGGLTKLQSGALYILALNADIDGFARISQARLAKLLSTSTGTVCALRAALIDRGYIERGERPSIRAFPQPYRLTESGLAMARALAGADFDGGGKA